MYKQKTFLAIIPARGGSKRLPNKNILDLNGKSLISYTIEAAKKSKYVDEVVVTSDSDTILNISNQFKIATIKRPPELATDTSSTFDVLKHVIDTRAIHYEYIVLLQPTSPLRTTQHIDEAIQLLEHKGADAIVSVCEPDHSPLWCNTLDENLDMSNFLNKSLLNVRSQDLPIYYRINGAIYICKTQRLLHEKTLFINDNIFAYIMDKKDSIDIDDTIDFLIAQTILENS